MTFFRRVQRDAYLISRTAGDLNAISRGRYVRRRARRSLTRALFRALTR